MNNIKNIKLAVKIFKKYKVKHILLHCTNSIPPHKLVRLGVINQLKLNFPNTIIGLSDHNADITGICIWIRCKSNRKTLHSKK